LIVIFLIIIKPRGPIRSTPFFGGLGGMSQLEMTNLKFELTP